MYRRHSQHCIAHLGIASIIAICPNDQGSYMSSTEHEHA